MWNLNNCLSNFSILSLAEYLVAFTKVALKFLSSELDQLYPLYNVQAEKYSFLIFDFCNNFDFFRAETKGIEGRIEPSLSEKIFNCKVNIARELQAPEYQPKKSIPGTEQI